MSITIRAKLPKGDTNGLVQLEPALAEDPDRTVVVIGLLRTDTIEDRPHDADNPRQVKAVLLHVEAIDGGDAQRADKMLRVAYQRRTGKTELPLYGEGGRRRVSTDTQDLLSALCDVFDLGPTTVTRLVLTVDVKAPYPVLDIEQSVTEDVDADIDELAWTFTSYELHPRSAL